MSEPTAPPGATFTCPSCGTVSGIPFCSHCGERKLGAEDRSLRHYFDIVADFLTHFDSKGYRSLWYLVTRPGFLSTEYLRGSRVRYAKPLSLFIALNVAYFLSIAIFGANTFTTPLAVQLGMNDYYAGPAQKRVERKMASENLTYPALEARYDAKAAVLSKTLIFLFIPIYALLFAAFFFRQRRFIVEHAIVATHLWAFILLLLTVLVPLIAIPLMWASHLAGTAAALAANDGLLTLVLQIAIGVYLALMFRRVYRTGIAYSIVVAGAIAWAFFHIVWLYRFLLFMITLYTL